MFRSLKTCAVVAVVPASAFKLVTSPEQGMSKPGAGMKPKEIEPFKDVHKDGFLHVTCVLDDMLLHGDKHGDNKVAYKLGDVAGVSIIRYTDMVAKMDRKPMTHTVCYDFCRTVPHMSFFGIQNGRECYCTPYFKQAASDSSDCDAPCDGDSSTVCGGKAKSSIFSMHWCDDTEEDFKKAKEAAEILGAALKGNATLFLGVSAPLQAGASAMQAAFGKVGDSVSSKNCQFGKVAAGQMEHGANDAMKAAEALLQSPSFSGDLRQAEKDTAKILELTAKGEKEMANLKSMNKFLWLRDGEDDSGKLYYPAMYFVDKEFEKVPQTCDGETAGGMVGNYEECATRCEAMGSLECSAFQYYPGQPKGACVFLKTVTGVRYYTGCGEKSFLQEKLHLDPFEYKCVLKFTEFNGLDLTPDKSGKNKMTLKELKKADRCFI